MLVYKSIEQHCLAFEDILGLWVESFFKQKFQALEHLDFVRLRLMMLALRTNANLNDGDAL